MKLKSNDQTLCLVHQFIFQAYMDSEIIEDIDFAELNGPELKVLVDLMYGVFTCESMYNWIVRLIV